MDRRWFIAGGAAAGPAMVSGGVADEGCPSRTIRPIAPYPPGGQTDIVARVLAAPLGGALNPTVVVENNPSGNGIVGDDYVAKAAPDGYTLLIGNSRRVGVLGARNEVASHVTIRPPCVRATRLDIALSRAWRVLRAAARRNARHRCEYRTHG